MVNKIKRVFRIKDSDNNIEKDTDLLNEELNIIEANFDKINTLKQLTYIFEYYVKR